jgi:hypothetical protein
MTCKEFKDKFPDTMLLAFVMDRYTHLYKFNSDIITFFIRNFVDKKLPKWNKMFFYKIEDEKRLLTDDGRLTKIKDKAKFLHYIVRAEEQKVDKCFIKWVPNEPDLRVLEGKKVKVITLKAK